MASVASFSNSLTPLNAKDLILVYISFNVIGNAGDTSVLNITDLKLSDENGNEISSVVTNGTLKIKDDDKTTDSDNDGVADSIDAFPNDPAASVDSDGDGYPDSWNDGYTQNDSTTGLTLDAYPNDSSRWMGDDGDKTIESFVERLYKNILEREPDNSGLDYWINRINSTSAEDAIMGFFYSKEFLSKNLSNEEFVKITYDTILGRAPDSSGLQHWVGKLDDGFSRLNILYGFMNSAEFKNLTSEYGVRATNKGVNNDYPTTGVEGYVNRIYVQVLGRNPDSSGFDNWVTQLQNGSKSGGDIAKGFFASTEFKNRNLSDGDFVDTAYKAFFDREADSSGKNNWLTKLKQGFSKEYVLNGFIHSTEFENLADKYNIIPYFEDAPNIPDTQNQNSLVGNWNYTYQENGCGSLAATGRITFEGNTNKLTHISYNGKDINSCSLIDVSLNKSISLTNNVDALKYIDSGISECNWINSSEISCSYLSYGGTIILKKQSNSDQNSFLKYIGNWSGISHLYLTNDTSVYCKWRWNVTINSDGKGSITSTLVDHNRDEGYCANYGKASFYMTNVTDNGFTGNLSSSDTALFGGVSSLYMSSDSSNSLTNTANLSIEGYPAKRDTRLQR